MIVFNDRRMISTQSSISKKKTYDKPGIVFQSMRIDIDTKSSISSISTTNKDNFSCGQKKISTINMDSFFFFLHNYTN